MPEGTFAGGSGSAGNPYQISTCTQLQAINDSLSAYYVLNNNINCGATSGWNGGAGFVPISNFTGNFNGKNYTIDSLYINKAGTGNGNGLFAKTLGAVIQNVKLTNASLTFSGGGTGYTGGLAGYVDNSQISQVSFSGNLNAGMITGGLIGAIWNNTSLTRAEAHGTMSSSSSYIGGLVGWIISSHVSDSYTEITITGAANSGGAFANRIWTEGAGTTASIVRSYSAGVANITNYSAAFVSTVENYGGGPVTFSNVLAAATYNTNYLSNFYAYNNGQYAPAITAGYFDATKANGGLNTNCGNYGTQADCYNINSNTLYNTGAGGPFSTWNFDTIWKTRAGGLPILRTVPSSVRGLSSTDTGAYETTLNWDAPATGDTPTNYIINYRKVGDVTWLEADTNSNDLEYELTGLEDETDYEFKVAATDGDNQGEFSSVSIFTTTLDNPPTFPDFEGGQGGINIVEGQLITTNPYIIKVRPTDIEGGIEKVEFYIDNVLICTTTTSDVSGVYSCGWDTSKYHSDIKVLAYDTSNNPSVALTRSAIVDPNIYTSSSTIPYMIELPATGATFALYAETPGAS